MQLVGTQICTAAVENRVAAAPEIKHGFMKQGVVTHTCRPGAGAGSISAIQ